MMTIFKISLVLFIFVFSIRFVINEIKVNKNLKEADKDMERMIEDMRKANEFKRMVIMTTIK